MQPENISWIALIIIRYFLIHQTNNIFFQYIRNIQNYILIGYLGNVIGALIFGLICKEILSIPEFVQPMIDSKVNDSWYGLILKGMFCGILIYLAVEGFKKSKTDIGKYVILILCVGAFIVCGFEHSIADAFYFSLSNDIFSTIPALLLITLGNTIGGLLFPFINIIIGKE